MTDLPKLIVFDLDFTLWSAGGLWIDCTAWPFNERDGKIFDAEEREFKLYPDIEPIVQQLQEDGCLLGIASRTSEPGWARWVLDIWELREQFDFEEIYPGSKITHFEALRDKSEIEFEEMLFFDDEQRNIDEVGNLGVCSVLVENGVTRSRFEHGVNLWRKSKN
ncbi:MAG: magnesium-dependent phosphatase-1 [Verrucomicrobiota bacterium]